MSRYFVAQVIYYLGWLAMVAFETTIWVVSGFVVGGLLFVVGGWLWAMYSIRCTTVGDPLHGPILKAISWLLGRNSRGGLVLATFLGGAPGVGLVLKQQGHKKVVLLSLFAAIGYTAIWATIHYLRPSAGFPVKLWPQL